MGAKDLRCAAALRCAAIWIVNGVHEREGLRWFGQRETKVPAFKESGGRADGVGAPVVAAVWRFYVLLTAGLWLTGLWLTGLGLTELALVDSVHFFSTQRGT